MTRYAGSRRAAAELAEFRRLVSAHYPVRDAELIGYAYARAAHAHAGQRRRSGDPYITHPVAVALMATQRGTRTAMVCAALLHDVLEDTACTEAELRAQFGAEVADLVTAATGPHEQVTGDDALTLRILDRLHNMRTIRYLEPDRQRLRARHSIRVVAPAARALGLDGVGAELEELAGTVLARPPRPRRLADRMLAVPVSVLPAPTRGRWRQEWAGELATLPTRRERAAYLFQTVRAAPTLAVILRRR